MAGAGSDLEMALKYTNKNGLKETTDWGRLRMDFNPNLP